MRQNTKETLALFILTKQTALDINSVANNETCTDEYGNEYPPFTREGIFKVIENAEILKTNIEKYIFAICKKGA